MRDVRLTGPSTDSSRRSKSTQFDDHAYWTDDAVADVAGGHAGPGDLYALTKGSDYIGGIANRGIFYYGN